MSICKVLFLLLRGLFVSRSNLIIENLALRQQLTIQQRTIKRPKLKRKDRIFWAWLSRTWPQWKSALIVVKPETVIKWHRQGFKLYWRWKSRPSKVGRPIISKEIRDLIRQMSQENPTWGAPRIQSELKLLGHEVADFTVAKSILRTSNRLNKKRMSGSLHYPKRKSFVSHSQRLHGLLQQLQNSSFA